MISENQKNTNLNDAMLTSQRVRHLLDPTTWIPAASTLRPNQRCQKECDTKNAVHRITVIVHGNYALFCSEEGMYNVAFC